MHTKTYQRNMPVVIIREEVRRGRRLRVLFDTRAYPFIKKGHEFRAYLRFTEGIDQSYPLKVTMKLDPLTSIRDAIDRGAALARHQDRIRKALELYLKRKVVLWESFSDMKYAGFCEFGQLVISSKSSREIEQRFLRAFRTFLKDAPRDQRPERYNEAVKHLQTYNKGKNINAVLGVSEK